MTVSMLRLGCSCGATFEAHKDTMASQREPGPEDLGSAWHKLHAACRKLAQTPPQQGEAS